MAPPCSIGACAPTCVCRQSTQIFPVLMTCLTESVLVPYRFFSNSPDSISFPEEKKTTRLFESSTQTQGDLCSVSSRSSSRVRILSDVVTADAERVLHIQRFNRKSYLLPVLPQRSDETRSGNPDHSAHRLDGSSWCLQRTHKHARTLQHWTHGSVSFGVRCTRVFKSYEARLQRTVRVGC